MNVRLDNGRLGQDGQSPGRQPLRIIADSRWRTPANSRILADPAKVIIAGTRDVAVPPELEASGAQCLALPSISGRIDLGSLLSRLAQMEVNEVQVEAGARLCGALLKNSLVDELLIYQAPHLLGQGGPGPFHLEALESMEERTHLKLLETRRIGTDWRFRLVPEYRN
jgi:diaminohydroxyphosphoribosylaminopyrimidine deaminase/5-amino-6-(5-phosphoribosylamino)uracil reductase